jgi:hypothetical protein
VQTMLVEKPWRQPSSCIRGTVATPMMVVIEGVPTEPLLPEEGNHPAREAHIEANHTTQETITLKPSIHDTIGQCESPPSHHEWTCCFHNR